MKPILFSTPMVNAILQGRKTQTRRIVKPQPEQVLGHFFWKGTDGWHAELIASKCKYQPGDILYVQETWAKTWDHDEPKQGFVYKAEEGDDAGIKWKPSTQMPKEAARIFLRVKSVKAERLHDISDDDAANEGVEVKVTPNADAGDYNCYPRNYMLSEKEADGWPFFKEEEYAKSYLSLFESIHGKKILDANPWVWVLEFERVEKTEDSV